MQRCKWCNPQNPTYVKYHDEEWGKPNFDERYLFEMLLLESFQAGLSWECVLNKREAFRKAFDGFGIDRVALYDEAKIEALRLNPDIIRNGRKIRAAVENAKIFKRIQAEFGSFKAYLETFTKGERIVEIGKTTSKLSDTISKDLVSRGMKFVGSTIIYSYLQAIGVINSHEPGCFLHKG